MKGLSGQVRIQSNNIILNASLLAAFGSMRGGGRIRPEDGGPSERLLKDAPPNVAARSSFGGEVGDTVLEFLGDVGGAVCTSGTGAGIC